MKNYNVRVKCIADKVGEYRLINPLVCIEKMKDGEEDRDVFPSVNPDYEGRLSDFYFSHGPSFSYENMGVANRQYGSVLRVKAKLNEKESTSLLTVLHPGFVNTFELGSISRDGTFRFSKAPSLYHGLGWWLATKPEFFFVDVNLSCAVRELMCESHLFNSGKEQNHYQNYLRYFIPHWEKFIGMYKNHVPLRSEDEDLCCQTMWEIALKESIRRQYPISNDIDKILGGEMAKEEELLEEKRRCKDLALHPEENCLVGDNFEEKAEVFMIQKAFPHAC